MSLLEGRLLITGNGDPSIETVLEGLRVDYDWDSGDRLMINLNYKEEIVTALENAGYNVDVIY